MLSRIFLPSTIEVCWLLYFFSSIKALDRALLSFERVCLNPVLFIELAAYGSILPVWARCECRVFV